jgi:hypothetical protein
MTLRRALPPFTAAGGRAGAVDMTRAGLAPEPTIKPPEQKEQTR